MPNFRKKVVPIIGDLNVENLGLSENDKNMLIRKVSNLNFSYSSLHLYNYIIRAQEKLLYI